MTKPKHYPRRGFTSLGRWAATPLLLAALVFVTGCGASDNGPRQATPTSRPTASATAVPTATPNVSQETACTKLQGCGQCFINAGGNCLSVSDCAQRLSADEAACLNGVSGCNANELGNCFPPGCSVNGSSDSCQ
ncbi:MAG: hypothetical protein HY270_20845 [Deltaproteobacteria bacterium]|nr:hypothetical protein [Deltaproteobacteria bacterium]